MDERHEGHDLIERFSADLAAMLTLLPFLAFATGQMGAFFDVVAHDEAEGPRLAAMIHALDEGLQMIAQSHADAQDGGKQLVDNAKQNLVELCGVSWEVLFEEAGAQGLLEDDG